MIKKLINYTNLNTKAMFKYGSIATISMFFIIFLFGVHNGMLAFPIALTAISLSFEDIYVKTLNKTLKLIFIDISIITASYLASINPYVGIPINFLTVFTIAYFLTAKFNPKIYKPFMMLFVFTSFSKVSFEAYITRATSVFLGILFVILITLLTSRKTIKKVIVETVKSPLSILNALIESILKDGDSLKLNKSLSASMRNLCYKIYATRYKNTLTTNIGKLQFDIYISIEKLNIYIYSLKDSRDFKPLLKDLHLAIDKTLSIIKHKQSFKQDNPLQNFISKYSSKALDFHELYSILNLLETSLLSLNSLEVKSLNKIYSSWSRSELENLKLFVKSNFNPTSIRFRFSMRVSLALTLTIFLGHIISLQKFIWVAITIMSVMQPYSEETLSKGRDRVKGNIIGITFIVTLLHFTGNLYIAAIVLIISLYLTYGFKEYYKLSIFTSIASISIAALSMGLPEITISRISFIVLGLFIVVTFNKFVFPYTLSKGVKSLTSKLLFYNTLLIEEYYKFKNDFKNFNSNRFRDIIILSTLYQEKLLLRNAMLKNKDIETVASTSNALTITIAFNALAKNNYSHKIKD